NNIHYCGPTERQGYGEANVTPVVLYVRIHKITKEVIVEDIPLQVRPMLDLEPIDAEGKTIEDINTLIEKRLTSEDLTDAIVRLRIQKLPKHLKPGINVELISELTQEALHFKLDLKDKTEKTAKTKTASDVKFEGVAEGWKTFMLSVEDDGTFNKDKVEIEGYERLADAQESKQL